MPKVVHAYPTKEFFVNMITRDIDLEDCVLDLLDNTIDGARNSFSQRDVSKGNGYEAQEDLSEYNANVSISDRAFIIEDNCGGITIENATNYAFHFGRKRDAPMVVQGAIGLYGIGMKRAVFKIGKRITIRSSTTHEAFRVYIDVDSWLKDPKNWDFELIEEDVWEKPGTRIIIEGIYKQVGLELNSNAFMSNLLKVIARDYAFILKSGFSVNINDVVVEPYLFELRESDQIKPARLSFLDKSGVSVEISAGMADIPPDDSSPEELNIQRRRETEYYGWFVVCNNRVVLAADRTDRTIWGDDGFARWHSQYNGFIGIVKFFSNDPSKLPWTTTKRDVDEANPVYRKAVTYMKEVTKPWITYTTSRKQDLKRAKVIERIAVAKPIEKLEIRKKMELPIFKAVPRIRMANIQYQKPLEEVKNIRTQLDQPGLAYSEIGRITFEYYIDHEVEE